MITIIGAGWYGCYLGMKFKDLGVDFEILEKNHEIFEGSSSFNQNRLHQGFHYPRDFKTRKESKYGFDRFIKEFPNVSTSIQDNIYAIHNASHIDFNSYLAVFSHERYNYKLLDNHEIFDQTKNYEGCISVDERLIGHQEAKNYFSELELPIQFDVMCQYREGKIVGNRKSIESDLIIDCTYGQMQCPIGFYNEDYLTLIYGKKKNPPFGALTVMDGAFYSLYPYKDDLFTLTGVLEGVINKREYQVFGEKAYVSRRKEMLEKKVLADYPEFLNHFSFDGHFMSKKLKPDATSQGRSTFIKKHDNIVTVCSGKVDTVFELDSFVSEVKVLYS